MISGGRNVTLAAGVVAGVPAEIYDTVDGFAQMASHPIDTLKALNEFFTSGEVLSPLGQSYVDRINKMEEEYERAGAGGSFNAGLEVGKLLSEVASLVVGGAGVAKEGVKLGEKALIKFLARKDFAQFASKKNLAELAAQGDPAKYVAKKELTKRAIKEKKNWLKEKPTKFTDSKTGQTNKVYKKEDLFDPNRVSYWMVKGEKVWGTNVDRMKAGRAPIGFDNKSVELHHLKQTHEGPIAEIGSKDHKKYTSVIHVNPKTHQSLIEREKFDLWRGGILEGTR